MQLGVRVSPAVVSLCLGKQEKQLFLSCGLYFEAMCHNSTFHTISSPQSNQPTKQKSLSLLFSVHLAFYIIPCRSEVSPAPPFREKVSNATWFLWEDGKYKVLKECVWFFFRDVINALKEFSRSILTEL